MPTAEPPHEDDNLMERFDRAGTRRFRARDALLAIAVAAVVLVLAAGGSIRKAGEEMPAGIGRDAVLAIGKPAAWIADQLPVHRAVHTLTAWVSPDGNLNGPGSFSRPVMLDRVTVTGNGIPPVTPDAFAPSQIGAPSPARRSLHSLLVTGDSMSEPLDQDLAQQLIPNGVHVIQDPHIGTGISNSVLLDWGKLSVHQVRQYDPQAVVIFIGANDGYAMPGPNGKPVGCCSAGWAAIYAGRVRQMMNTYRRAGAARVYWLTLPTPRDSARAKISLVVNAAIEVAAEPWRDQIRIVDTVPVFTPGERYRDSMTIDGVPTIVRQSDGIHLNDAGSSLAAKLVLADIDQDFTR
ncbi:MAG: GDSL-type esterase/lipase family protein [Solirubrobacteraceae bacterium]